MNFRIAIMSAAISLVPLAPAFAQVKFGGWVGAEYDTFGDLFDNYVRIDALLSYKSGDLEVGIGLSNEYASDQGTPFYVVEGGLYYFVNIRDIVVTFGEIWGAGNMFPEDYFTFGDTTSNSGSTLRVDFEVGGNRFAASYDMDSGEPFDFELGFQGTFGSFDVVAAYEADAAELGLILGQDRGKWGWQAVVVQDFDGSASSSEYGVTLFYDIMPNLSILANYAVDSRGDPDGWGVISVYETDFGTLKAEYVNFIGEQSLEFGVIFPFGDEQSFADSRFSLKEYQRGMIYY